MLPTEQASSNIPAFLAKLWNILLDDRNNDLIAWNSNGLSFVIKDQTRFTKELLPNYFKHANMASFIRQLNMYGFKKLMNLEQGLLHTADRDDISFQHQYFNMNDASLLGLIKRKNTVMKIDVKPTETATAIQTPEQLSKMMEDISSLKSKQVSMDSNLTNIKKENETLWRELVTLRHKHSNQQKVVNKLIGFLAQIIQQKGAQSSGLKRKCVPMLQNSPENEEPPQKVSWQRQLSIANSSARENSGGPVIHDVTGIDASDIFINQPETSNSPGIPCSLEEVGDIPIIEVPDTPATSDIGLSTDILTPETIDGDPVLNTTDPGLPTEVFSNVLDSSLESTSGLGHTNTTVSLSDHRIKRDLEHHFDSSEAQLESLKDYMSKINWDSDSLGFSNLGAVNWNVDSDSLCGLSFPDLLNEAWDASIDDNLVGSSENIIGNEIVHYDNSTNNISQLSELDEIFENCEPVSISDDAVKGLLKEVDGLDSLLDQTESNAATSSSDQQEPTSSSNEREEPVNTGRNFSRQNSRSQRSRAKRK